MFCSHQLLRIFCVPLVHLWVSWMFKRRWIKLFRGACSNITLGWKRFIGEHSYDWNCLTAVAPTYSRLLSEIQSDNIRKVLVGSETREEICSSYRFESSLCSWDCWIAQCLLQNRLYCPLIITRLFTCLNPGTHLLFRSHREGQNGFFLSFEEIHGETFVIGRLANSFRQVMDHGIMESVLYPSTAYHPWSFIG